MHLYDVMLNKLFSVWLSFRLTSIWKACEAYSIDNSSLTHRVPWTFWCNIRKVMFKLNLMVDGWGIYWEIAIRWMPLNITYHKSTLVQVIASCTRASHCQIQCWHSFMWSYGVTRPQWGNFCNQYWLNKSADLNSDSKNTPNWILFRVYPTHSCWCPCSDTSAT